MSKQLSVQEILDRLNGRNTNTIERNNTSTNQYHTTPISTTQNTPIINNIVVNNITVVSNEPVEQKVCYENSTRYTKRDTIDSINDICRMIF